MRQDPTYPTADVIGLGHCGRHGFAELEDRPHASEVRGTTSTSCKGRAQGKCNQNQGDENSVPQQTLATSAGLE